MRKFLINHWYLLSLRACFKAARKIQGDPPVLPPSESMTIDFSNFEDAKKETDPFPFQKELLRATGSFAAGAAIIWKAIIYVTLAVPVYSFELAVDQTPVYLEDKHGSGATMSPCLILL